MQYQIPPVASASGCKAAHKAAFAFPVGFAPSGPIGGRRAGRLLPIAPNFVSAPESSPAGSPPTAAPTSGPKPCAIVYIDGFNLYYGALKGTPYRWLDLMAFARNLLPKNDVQRVKYFTARVKARPADPTTAVHQQAYLRALATLPDLEVFLGHYLSHTVSLPLADPAGGVRLVNGRVQFAQVVKEEEKGSDVHLATQLVHDAHRGAFDVALVVSNDSDLVPPIALVTQTLGLRVGVANPHKNQSVQLASAASFLRPMRPWVLARSQLPATLIDEIGTFHKPTNW